MRMTTESQTPFQILNTHLAHCIIFIPRTLVKFRLLSVNNS